MASKFYTVVFLLLAVFAGQSVHAQGIGNWSNTGPVTFPVNVSGQIHGIGRVSQIKFHPTNNKKIYAVSASGGLFVTSNTGVSWAPLSGTEKLPQTSSSSVCINWANDKTLYLCLGDANYYSNNYGIYKSLDGGTTWNAANTGVGTAMAVEILMDPTDTNKLVAATRSGIYRTTNGGASWSQTQTGAFRDMKAKPVANGQTLYAATANAFYVSTNFGASWTATSGITFPSGNGGIRIAVSAADTTRVYLATTHGNGVVYKSTNSGASFTQVYSSTAQCITCYDASVTSGSQNDYNFDMTANPLNADELLLIAHCVWRSTNGGANWSKRTTWYNEVHTDMHHIEWSPYNPSQIWTANDGGVWMSTDTLATIWNPRSDGIAASEIYKAAQSPVTRNLISIGTQDNGELYYSSLGWRTNRGGDWTTPCTIDYRGSGTVWYTAKGNRRNLSPLGSDQSYNPPYITATGTFVQTDRSRIEFIKGLPTVAFTSKDSVYRCSNTAATTPSWQRILLNTGTIRDMVSCHADSNILYVAVAPSTLYRSDNALAATPTWTSLATPGSMATAGSIATSKTDPQVVFMSCGNQVYRSTNKGVSWTNITGTGLSGLNIRRIYHDDYSTTQRLFVNAGAYVHFKDSTTTTWSSQSGIPTVANGTDFMIYNDGTAASVLRLATYGRGVWECSIHNNVAPVADFFSDKQVACPGDSIHFSEDVNGGYSSLSWSFSGGSPGTSTATNPVVAYASPGVYAVTLTATNSFGSNTITKTGYITVSNGQTSAVVEGFEGTTYPPANWDAPGSWVKTARASGYGLSSKSVIWDNYNIDGGGVRDPLYAPKLNLSGISNARLKFDVAYAPYDTSASSGYIDTLQVRASIDCGRTWTTIYNKAGATLGTAPALTDSAFVPTASQWRTDSVSLAPFAGNTVLISFDNIGHYGQALYLDNINIAVGPSSRFGASPKRLCAGGTVSFTDSSVNATSWSWSFPGGTPSSATTPNATVTYATAGSYTATLTTANSFANSNSQVAIQVLPVPKPVITATGSMLAVSGTAGSTYQWYQNGVAIAGATGTTLNAPDSGSYTVTETSTDGCVGTSPAYGKLAVADALRNAGFELFPNPSKGIFTIKASGLKADELTLSCYDAAGRLMRTEVLKGGAKLNATIDWSTLPRGVYNISLQAPGAVPLRSSIVIQ